MSTDRTRALLLGGPMDGTRLVLRGRPEVYAVVHSPRLSAKTAFEEAAQLSTLPPFSSAATRVYRDARVHLTALVASGIDRVFLDEAEDPSPENVIRLLIQGYGGSQSMGLRSAELDRR